MSRTSSRAPCRRISGTRLTSSGVIHTPRGRRYWWLNSWHARPTVGRVDDRQQLLEVLAQDPVEQRLVAVLEGREPDVPLEVVRLAPDVLELQRHLGVDVDDLRAAGGLGGRGASRSSSVNAASLLSMRSASRDDAAERDRDRARARAERVEGTAREGGAGRRGGRLREGHAAGSGSWGGQRYRPRGLRGRRGGHRQVACGPRQRATTTVACAWAATCSDTLPWSARATVLRPRDPMTMVS